MKRDKKYIVSPQMLGKVVIFLAFLATLREIKMYKFIPFAVYLY